MDFIENERELENKTPNPLFQKNFVETVKNKNRKVKVKKKHKIKIKNKKGKKKKNKNKSQNKKPQTISTALQIR